MFWSSLESPAIFSQGSLVFAGGTGVGRTGVGGTGVGGTGGFGRGMFGPGISSSSGPNASPNSSNSPVEGSGFDRYGFLNDLT